MRSWVTSIQSLTPTSVPTADLISSKPSNTRIWLTWLVVGSSEHHGRNAIGNDEFGVRHRHDLGDAGARCDLQQGRLAARKTDHSHLGHDKVDRPGRSQWQVAFGDDLGLALGRMLHGDD